MIYKFNEVDISTYGVLPRRDESGLALSGMFDFPKRNGTTEHNWGNRVEPYVAESDLAFGSRKLNLKLVMTDLDGLAAFRTAWQECTLLGTDWGDFRVIAADEMKVEKVGGKMGLLELSFLQPEVEWPELTLPGTGGEGWRLDEWQLEHDLGIRVAGVKNELNLPKRIEVGTTEVYPVTCYRENGTMTLECTMLGKDMAGMVRQMGQWHAICALPGLRVLQLPEGDCREVYLKEGFKVNMNGNCMAAFSLKMEVL